MELVAPKQKIEPRITRGNLWTIATVVAGVLGGTGYQHYHPSEAAEDAKATAVVAVSKAEESAAKAAVLAQTVELHGQELGQLMVSMSDIKMDIAVLKSQGTDAKVSAQTTSDKLDQVLAVIYRMQGADHAPPRPSQ